jgi:hypothetical protein
MSIMMQETRSTTLSLLVNQRLHMCKSVHGERPYARISRYVALITTHLICGLEAGAEMEEESANVFLGLRSVRKRYEGWWVFGTDISV